MVYQSESLLHKLENQRILQYILLAIITIIAAALRLYKLGEWSFWIEEIHTLRHTQSLGNVDIAYFFSRNHFYLLINIILTQFGVSEWNARFFPMILGIITIPICFWLYKRSFGLSLAYLAAFLLAISPWHIYWSQNARFYVYLLILFNASLFSFYWGLEKDQIRYFVISILTLGLATATNQFSMILVIIFIIYFMLLKFINFDKPRGFRMRILLYFVVIPLLGYVFYEAFRFYSGDPFLYLQLYNHFFNQATISFIGSKNAFILLTSTIYYIGVPLALLSLIGSYRFITEKSRIGLLIILGAYIPLLIMMLLTSFASTSNRYVFMVLPCWVLLAAAGGKELYNLAQRNVYILAIYFLPLMLLSMKDPALEDLYYYIIEKQIGFYVVGMVVLVGILIVVSLVLSTHMAKKKGHYLWGIVVLLPLLVHPIIVNSLYYAYQHGHRDNWKAVSQAINTLRIDKAPVVTYLPPLAEYYVGDPVLNITEVDLDQIVQQHGRVWFVEDETFAFVSDIQFESWARDKCVVMGQWDQFTGGRLWKMRLFECGETY